MTTESTHTESTYNMKEISNMGSIIKKVNVKRCSGWFLALVTALISCIMITVIRKAEHTSASVFLFSRGFSQLFGCIAFGCFRLNLNVELENIYKNSKLIALRTINTSILLILKFYVCKLLPITQISVFGQLRPIVTAILARVFLKEKLTILHLFSTFTVVIGAVLVLQPGILFSKLHLVTPDNNKYLALGFTMVSVSVLSVSIATIISRQLNILKVHWVIHNSIGSMCFLTSAIVAYSIFINIESFPEIPLSWNSICKDRWYIIAGCCLGFINQFCIFKSMQYEKASVVSIIRTADVLIAFSIGLLFFPDEKYNYIHLIGSLLIVSGVLVIGIKNVITE